MSDNLISIFGFIKLKAEISYSDLKSHFSAINEATLIRNLNKLINEGKVIKIKNGKNTLYKLVLKESVLDHFKTDFFNRPQKTYNFDFLKNYIPNKTSFLGDKYDRIKSRNNKTTILSTYDYQSNIRGIENLLIDLSYASSHLEGNTYTYLDTEILIKYNEEAEGKSKIDTQMILNHKDAIKYIINNKNEIKYGKTDFFNIHSLLGKGLILDRYLGAIRNHPVKIGGSTYAPLDNAHQLNDQFELFLKKLSEINNPYEQSLFILVFIPYFQLFMDINKRTSRLSANIPLIKNGLAPLSLLQIKDRDYINAILAIYELNDVSLMSEIYVENYLMNMSRYVG